MLCLSLESPSLTTKDRQMSQNNARSQLLQRPFGLPKTRESRFLNSPLQLLLRNSAFREGLRKGNHTQGIDNHILL